MAMQRTLLSALDAGACRRALSACVPRLPPPCPPCAPPPRPPCRAQEGERRSAVRVVCCPPPQGRQPPCAPPPPVQPVTCRDQNHKLSKCERVSEVEEQEAGGRCGCGARDRVALRLQLADGARRRHYEREAAERARQPARPAPPAPYGPLAGRECALATDGCIYTVSHAEPDRHAGCGPDRAPPAPRRVWLAPDDGCRFATGAALDPCAHRPRELLEIDRTPKDEKIVPPTAAAPRPEPPENLASRAGDAGWCERQAPPAAAPKRCRPPSIVERLRGLPAPPKSRELHTTVALFDPSEDPNKTSPGATEPSSPRRRLNEAGVGRATLVEEGGRGRPAAGGRLDLRVPAGAERVRVEVTLQETRADHELKRAPERTLSGYGTSPAPFVNFDKNSISKSWSSITKNLHKKLAGFQNKKSQKPTEQLPSQRCPSSAQIPKSPPRPAIPHYPPNPQCPPCPPFPPCPPTPAPRDIHKPAPKKNSPCASAPNSSKSANKPCTDVTQDPSISSFFINTVF